MGSRLRWYDLETIGACLVNLDNIQAGMARSLWNYIDKNAVSEKMKHSETAWSLAMFIYRVCPCDRDIALEAVSMAGVVDHPENMTRFYEDIQGHIGLLSALCCLDKLVARTLLSHVDLKRVSDIAFQHGSLLSTVEYLDLISYLDGDFARKICDNACVDALANRMLKEEIDHFDPSSDRSVYPRIIVALYRSSRKTGQGFADRVGLDRVALWFSYAWTGAMVRCLNELWSMDIGLGRSVCSKLDTKMLGASLSELRKERELLCFIVIYKIDKETAQKLWRYLDLRRIAERLVWNTGGRPTLEIRTVHESLRGIGMCGIYKIAWRLWYAGM